MIKIIVPTDFSDNAYHALRYAIYLFEKEECTFYILNAFQIGTSNLETIRNKKRNTRLYKITKEASEKGLMETLSTVRIENDNPKHIFKTISIADSLVNVIGKSVLDLDIYYIFMGTKGASGLKSVFLGSNTVKIISKIDFCPIVAVPADYSFDIPDEILFATGFEHIYDKYELHPMLVLSKLWNSKIRVLHLVDEEKKVAHKETAKKVIEKRLQHVPYEIIEIEKKNKVSTEIAKLVEQNEDIGMVAMIDYWHSFIQKLTREQVVKNVAFSTKVPFLVMHLLE
ncbi:universal stress protein [uncultured Croceitalea sp.]|uniref:universal stress protein n=1 Tax=uncultured Croceitalea sp. TaxID=1798908 RepID=UPI00374F268F